MEPIKENIQDKNIYVRVMPFLDNEKVQQEILRVRNLIHNLIPSFTSLIPQGEYNKWFDYATQAKETMEIHSSIMNLYPHECVNILEKFGRQDIHYHALWKAIVCGEITDSDCPSVWVDVTTPNGFSVLPRLVIVIQPQTTWEEIEKVLKSSQTKKTIEQYEQFEIGNGIIPCRLVGENDSIETFKKQRELFLIYKPKIFGYQRTANTMGVKEDRSSKEQRKDLEKARTKIETYKNRVERSIRVITPLS